MAKIEHECIAEERKLQAQPEYDGRMAFGPNEQFECPVCDRLWLQWGRHWLSVPFAEDTEPVCRTVAGKPVQLTPKQLALIRSWEKPISLQEAAKNKIGKSNG